MLMNMRTCFIITVLPFLCVAIRYMTELKNKNLKRESKKGKKEKRRTKEKKKKENSLGPLCPRSHAPRNLPSSHQLLLLPKNDYSGSLICSSIPMYTYRNRASVFVMLINLKIRRRRRRRRERERFCCRASTFRDRSCPHPKTHLK